MCSVSDALEMDLMQGDLRKGAVSVMDNSGMRFVALEEVMARLAFAASPSNGGFVVTYSGKKIEFWNGTSAARINGSVSPLATVVKYDGTHWWGEVNSSIQAIDLFLTSVSRPSGIRLVPASPQPAVSRNVPVAPPIVAQTPPPADRPSSAPTALPQLSGSKVEISRVRWGEQVDAYRAVVDVSEQTDAILTERPGSLEIRFRNAKTADISGRSPWPPLDVTSKAQGNDVVLSFAHSSQMVKGFWVAEPPRYVVDFYFGESPAPIPAIPQNTVPIKTTPKPAQPAQKDKFLIVIDAGHGGHDGGAVGNNLKEKDMNLLAALQLGISLKALGADVKLTRQDDRYLKLAERTEIANATNADVFISLHCNAVPKGKHATGTELYLMAEQTDQDALNLAILENRELSGSAESADDVNEAADKKTKMLLKILGDMQQSDKINESTTLAEFIYNKMRSDGFQLRKVRQAPFFVLRGAGMPAMLVEMGYISEASDAKLLNSQANRKKMMDSLAKGILNYLGKRTGEGGRQ
jgi:N-acetylmuramoyl-L-alanine amidase